MCITLISKALQHNNNNDCKYLVYKLLFESIPIKCIITYITVLYNLYF